MINIAFASDLHLEVSNMKPTPAMKKADLVVLAGDIGKGISGIEWAAQLNKPVIYVPGNHEYDFHDLHLLDVEMKNLKDTYPNVHVLQEGKFIYENVRFLGCTLWTDFELFGLDFKSNVMLNAKNGMPEYQCVRLKDKRLSPDDTLKIHNKHRDWLKFMLSEPFDGQTVVVTHHAPHQMSLNPAFAPNLLSSCFVNNLEYLLGLNTLWIHGHTHHAVNYDVAGTNIISNPRGYFKVKDQVPSQLFQEWMYCLE